MSMTKEEAIKILQHLEEIMSPGSYKETFKMAASALRPVTREQVEKVFPGCDFCNLADFGKFGFEITKYYAKICCALGRWRFPQNERFLFCPKCGKPLTDEAVDMVMERLEVLGYGKDD